MTMFRTSGHAFSCAPVLMLGLSCLLLAGCSDDPGDATTPGSAVDPGSETLSASLELDPDLQTAIQEVSQSYLDQIERDYQTLDSQVVALNEAVTDLLADPAQGTLAAAREAWLQAHSAHQATLLHQHFAGEVLPETLALRLSALSYQLDHWPILPGYVDAVSNYPDSGLVHDVNVPIDEATLRQVHGQFDLGEAALGFHVLEFLLWGDNTNPDSVRAAADFAPREGRQAELLESGLTADQLPENRRRALIDLVSRILLSDTQTSREITVQGLTSYGQELNTLAPAQALNQLLAALNTLLNDEFLVRSLYPMLNGDYVGSIQSPFSNATDNAVVTQLASVERLLLETRSSSGQSLDGILSQLSPDFEELFYQNFDASKECLVSLYSDLEEPLSEQDSITAEFSIVECINLLNNMIDHFEQVQVQLRAAPAP